MKTLLYVVCISVVSLSTVMAQDAELSAPRLEDGSYLQERRTQVDHDSIYGGFETAQQLVHRNAALQAAQRRERMAINARFGYSPSRPPASTVPFMGSSIAPPMTLRYYAPYPGAIFPRYYSRY